MGGLITPFKVIWDTVSTVVVCTVRNKVSVQKVLTSVSVSLLIREDGESFHMQVLLQDIQ